MNDTELSGIVRQFVGVEPGFLSWFNSRISEQRSFFDGDDDAAAVGLRKSWLSSLYDVTPAEGADVIGQWQRGELATPPYGEWARAMRTAVMENRRDARASERADWDHQPRVKCPLCFGRGMLEVFNPNFLIFLRPTFESITDPPPVGWWDEARKSWRIVLQQHNYGPDTFMVCCSCDCEQTKVYRAGIDEYRERGYRMVNIGGRPRKSPYPPSCGPDIFDPDLFQPTGFDKLASIREWYARHPAPHRYEHGRI